MKNKTLVIGLGNTLLRDDGVGIYVAREVTRRVGNLDNVDVVEASIGGIGLIDLMQGYDTVYIVDALKRADSVPGKTLRCGIEALGDPTYVGGPHFLDLRTAVELGKQCGFKMPPRIEIFAVEIVDNMDFSESLTPEVEKAVPSLVADIVAEIQKDTS
ncbi:MAG TPA: hypothetical protein DCR97_13145 [Deltaproteobacteria bacterium]|jgi:hydrogenase maturation protease|nr:hypothetical protein [Deltaproteobacteria bacterium]